MEPIAREYWEHQPERGGSAITGMYNPATRSPFSCPVHWHDFIELLFLRDGQADVIVGQTEFSVEQDDVLCINPNEPHAFHAREGASFGVVQLTLDLLASGQRDPAQFIHRFTGTLVLPTHIPHDHPHASLWRDQLHAIIRETELGDEFAILRATAHSLALIADMVQRTQASLPTLSTTPPRDLERLYLLQDFVRLHQAEDITLFDAAEALHISRPHLCRVLKQWTGHTFTEYLREVRITRAQHLLRTTDWPVTRVALEAGYASPTAFDRAFRMMTGMTPRAYRYGCLPTHHANSG